jgi:hypothetical protein
MSEMLLKQKFITKESEKQIKYYREAGMITKSIGLEKMLMAGISEKEAERSLNVTEKFDKVVQKFQEIIGDKFDGQTMDNLVTAAINFANSVNNLVNWNVKDFLNPFSTNESRRADREAEEMTKAYNKRNGITSINPITKSEIREMFITNSKNQLSNNTNKNNNDSSEVTALLKELVHISKKGAVINMDGIRVGEISSKHMGMNSPSLG